MEPKGGAGAEVAVKHFNGSPIVSDVYEFETILGSGGYADVVRAKHTATGQYVAIKVVDKAKVKNIEAGGARLMERVKTEIDVLSRCRHPNIVRLREVYETADDVSLVMDLMAGGELWDHVVRKARLSEEEAAPMLKEILAAVAYLHELDICHRDLKPENLLLEASNGPVRLADFGLARTDAARGAAMCTPCGTVGFTPPEMLPAVLDDGSVIPNPYSKSVDCWSVGCISFFMLFGRPPFLARTDSATNQLVLHGRWRFPDTPAISENARSFISGLLELNPNRRLTASQAARHAWLRSAESPRPATDAPNASTASGNASKGAAHSDEEVALMKAAFNAAIDQQRAGGGAAGMPVLMPEQSPLFQRRLAKRPPNSTSNS